jgi:hypothetical protein
MVYDARKTILCPTGVDIWASVVGLVHHNSDHFYMGFLFGGHKENPGANYGAIHLEPDIQLCFYADPIRLAEQLSSGFGCRPCIEHFDMGYESNLALFASADLLANTISSMGIIRHDITAHCNVVE